MEIKRLELFSPNLQSQKHFYHEVLGFDLVTDQRTSFSVSIGQSILVFKEKESTVPYHFAFNIPSYQEQEALAWLKSKVDVLTFGEEEIQYFDFWDAYAIYFLDADGNIAELIARRTLAKNNAINFDQNAILNISEMGVATHSIEKLYNELTTGYQLPIYSGTFERFCAVGDPNGLFILINKTEKHTWFPTEIKTESPEFSIEIEQGAVQKKYVFENDSFTVL